MAFQVIPQSNFASGIGSALGKGLADQLPKEIQRGALSAGLKQLGESKEQLNPMDIMTRGLSIPGMTPELLQQFIPMIQQIQSRRALEQKAKIGQESTRQVEPSQQTKAAPAEMGELRKRMESRDFAQPKDDKQIYQRALELSQINTNLNEQEAIAQAQAEDTRRIQSDQSLLNKSKMVEDEFDRITGTFLQKEGKDKFGDIIGEMQSDYLENARNKALDKGLSPLTAAREAANDLLNFAKARQQLRTNKSALIYGGKSGDKVLKDIQNLRSEYAKRGQLENLRNDLINYHTLTPENADRLAFPVTESPKSFISGLPKTHREKTKGFGQRQSLSTDQVRQISDKMSKEDSPRSIALELIKRGYDGSDFIDQIKQYSKDFNDRQKRELTSLSDRYSLGDIRLFGLKGLPDVGAKR